MANAEVRVAIVGDNSDLQASLDQSQSKLGAFGAAVGRVALAAGVAAAGGLALLGKASVDAASQAQQSIGATETVYGKYADTVVKQSKRAATALGLSADEYRTNANILGALLGNQGVAQDKLAGKTRGLVKTGADLAATFGGTTTDAVNALASAFKGEFDPLEQYGISIKQSTINTEAYRVAGVKTKSAFDKLTATQQAAAKQQATSNLLTQQSSKAQGQFARETDTLAHQQQVLNAQWENLKVTIGTALLPVVTDFVKVLNDRVVPAVSDLAKEHLPAIKQALQGLFDGDPGEGAAKFGDALKGIDWAELGDGVGDLATTAKELGPALADISAAGVNDTLKVFNVLVGFTADHLDLLRKVLPLIVAGYIALKAATVLNNLAGRDSLIGLGLQLVATRRLIVANRELAVVIREVNGAQVVAAGGTVTAGTAIGQTATKTEKLATAAKGAAGIAGIGALTVGMQDADSATGALLTTFGAAATGFAVGGPIGAAIGGLAGLTYELVVNTKDAGRAAQDSYKKIAAIDPVEKAAGTFKELADTLDQVTGAYTDSTRAAVLHMLQQNGAVDVAAKYGVSTRELVNAALGQKGALAALDPVMARYEQQIRDADDAQAALASDANNFTDTGFTEEAGAQYDALERTKKSAQQYLAEIQGLPGALKESGQAIRDNTKAVTDYSGKLKGLPPAAQTQIKAEGIAPTTRAIAKLAAQYRLTPKQIRTLIEATGTETTVKRVKRVRDALTEVKNTKPDLTRFSTGTNKFMSDLAPQVHSKAEAVGKAAKTGVQQGAKGVSLSSYQRDVRKGVDNAKSTASTGGNEVGSALKSGTLGGIAGLMPALSSAVAAAVNAAIAAGKRAARSHSPSKRMYELGTDIGDGLVLGVNAKQGDAAKAGQQLLEKLFGGAKSITSDDIKSGLGKVTDLIRKTTDQRIKDDKKAGKVADAILDGLRRRYKLLKANASAQRENNAALEKATETYNNLLATAEAVRATFVSFGDIAQLGRLDNGKVSLTKLLAQLRQRAADAREFSALMQQLAGMGLSQEQVNQLVESGPEAALATARAIASGGQAAVNEINALSADISSSGGTLGKALADKFSAVGTDSAKAYVDQLTAKQEQLNETARKMASALVRQLRDELAGVKPQGDGDGKGKGKGGKPKPKLSEDAVNGKATAPTVSVKLTSQQVSQLERGRAVQLDLDAYRAAGGRARA